MRKTIAAVLVGLLLLGGACDRKPASDVPGPIRDIGKEMLQVADDARAGKLTQDEAIDRIEALSDRIQVEADRLEGDEKRAAEYVDLRGNSSIGALYPFDDMDTLTIHEAARDELAAKIGEPTKYDVDSSMIDIMESMFSETVPAEWK